MSVMGNMGQHRPYTTNANATHAWVRCDTNSTNAPDGIIDEGKVVSSITRSGVGTFRFLLHRRWKRVIVAGVQIIDATADVRIRPTAVVEGAASTNSVTVIVEVGAAATDTNDKRIDLCLILKR